VKKTLLLLGLVGAIAPGCSSAPASRASGAAPTPTPAATLSRVNPYVIEETDTYTIQRYPKDEYIKLDERHIKREEDELLPMAARLLSDEDLARIGRAMRERRGIGEA